jgi:predicted ATPase
MRCQFNIATHSPILMSYPKSIIYRLGSDGIKPVPFEKTEHFAVTTDFLNNLELYNKILYGRPPQEALDIDA